MNEFSDHSPSSAFTAYTPSLRLENEPLTHPSNASGNPTVLLTAGSRSIFAPAHHEQRTSTAPTLLTLPDGRFNIGTHLPLLHGRYKYLAALGEGVSAQVFLAEDTLVKSRHVTIKAMKRQFSGAGQREARALRFMHSSAPNGQAPGIVSLLETFKASSHYCLVTERLYPRFLDWVADSTIMSPEASLKSLRKIAYQLLVSVLFMHEHGIVHADIKPDNILFTEPHGSPSVQIKLIDFGGAFSITENNTQQPLYEVQTLSYRAPEAALGVSSGPEIDMWSVGVILAEVALKRPMFPCNTQLELLKQMVLLLGRIPQSLLSKSQLAKQLNIASWPSQAAQPTVSSAGRQQLVVSIIGGGGVQDAANVPLFVAELQKMDPLLANLIQGLLEYDPAHRLTAKQALLHPFFKAILEPYNLLGGGLKMAPFQQQQKEQPLQTIELRTTYIPPPKLPNPNAAVASAPQQNINTPAIPMVDHTCTSTAHAASKQDDEIMDVPPTAAVNVRPVQSLEQQQETQSTVEPAASAIATDKKLQKHNKTGEMNAPAVDGQQPRRSNQQTSDGDNADNLDSGNRRKRRAGESKPWWMV